MMAKRENLWDAEYEIVKTTTVTHSGYFKMQDIFRLIDTWAKHHDYYKEVTAAKGSAKKEHTALHRSYEFHKRMSSTYFSVIMVSVDFSKVKEKILTIDGTREKYQQGVVEIELQGYNMSSAKFTWESRPAIAFMRGVIDKFVYKLNRRRIPEKVAADTGSLARELRSLLVTYKKRVK